MKKIIGGMPPVPPPPQPVAPRLSVLIADTSCVLKHVTSEFSSILYLDISMDQGISYWSRVVF